MFHNENNFHRFNRMEAVEVDQQPTGQERLKKARLRGKHTLEKEFLTEVVIMAYTEILLSSLLINQFYFFLRIITIFSTN